MMLEFRDYDTYKLKLHQHPNLVVSGNGREIRHSRHGVLDKRISHRVGIQDVVPLRGHLLSRRLLGVRIWIRWSNAVHTWRRHVLLLNAHLSLSHLLLGR